MLDFQNSKEENLQLAVQKCFRRGQTNPLNSRGPFMEIRCLDPKTELCVLHGGFNDVISNRSFMYSCPLIHHKF